MRRRSAALSLVSIVHALVRQRFAGQWRETAPGHRRQPTSDVQVDPGDTEIERGTSLLVVARFPGAVPAEASLVVEDQPTHPSRRAMTRSLEDPTFAGRVESVDTDLSYHVEFAGQSSPRLSRPRLRVPRARRTDARLVFPDYTSLEPKTVEDIRHVTAVEGTELTLLCRLNKDVAIGQAGRREGQGDRARRLDPERRHHVYRASFTLTDSQRYKVQLVDREGRATS